MTQTPLQTLISHIQEAIEANKKEERTPVTHTERLTLTSVLIAAQNLEGVEKDFVAKVWEAAEKRAAFSAEKHGSAYEYLIQEKSTPNKQQFIKSLYGE